MSMFDFVHLGSTFSLRSFGRMGGQLTMMDFVHLGSSISLRGMSPRLLASARAF